MAVSWHRYRHLLIGGLYLLAWTGLDVVSQRFLIAPGVTVWYPATGLDVVVLLLGGLRWWPLLVLSRLAHEFLVVPEPLPPAALLTYLVVTTVGPVLAVWLLRGLHFDARLPRLRDVVLLVTVAALGVPLVGAALQILNLTLAGVLPESRGVVYTLQLWAGVATGVGLLAPPLLLWVSRWLRTSPPPPPPARAAQEGRRAAPWRTALENLGEAVLIGLALWAGYGGPRSTSLDYSYALFVPLLWSATRHGFERTALTVLILNVGVALLTGTEAVRQTGGLALQFGLLTVTVSGLLLGAVLRERQHLTARLTHLALHDSLTGLGNRRLFSQRLAQALGRSSGGAATGTDTGTVAVLLLDFDNFKAINDSLGHSAGDEVLTVVGERLSAAARPADTVTRLGGDEFAVVLGDLRGPEEATELAGELLRALEPPIPVQGQPLRLGASAGLALHGAEQPDGETLLRNADVALYHAKAHRRGHVQVFDAPMHVAVVERLELEAELRIAIDQGALEVHYQPLVELRGGHLRGFEALVRWPHPTRGLLTPDVFVPLAEQTGLLVPLDRWVLRTAAHEVARWPVPAGQPPVSLGINLTAVHVHYPDVVEEVRAALEAAGMDPARIMLELTENVLMSETAATVATLRALRDLGVRLALDDFGTGYSSLSYLRQFPISDLKVDRSFMADLEEGGIGRELVRTLAVLGRTLDISTVAEGIETPAQYASVRALGYTQAQGYYISPPLPAAEARALVTRPGPLIDLPELEPGPGSGR